MNTARQNVRLTGTESGALAQGMRMIIQKGPITLAYMQWSSGARLLKGWRPGAR